MTSLKKKRLHGCITSAEDIASRWFQDHRSKRQRTDELQLWISGVTCQSNTRTIRKGWIARINLWKRMGRDVRLCFYTNNSGSSIRLRFRSNVWHQPKDHSIVHCIAIDAKMRAGFANQVRVLWPDLPAYIRSRHPSIGDCIRYVPATAWNAPVYHLITKEWSSTSKPTMDSFTRAFQTFTKTVNETTEGGATSFVAPMLGCGLDRLFWPDVLSTCASLWRQTNGCCLTFCCV